MAKSISDQQRAFLAERMAASDISLIAYDEETKVLVAKRAAEYLVISGVTRQDFGDMCRGETVVLPSGKPTVKIAERDLYAYTGPKPAEYVEADEPPKVPAANPAHDPAADD